MLNRIDGSTDGFGAGNAGRLSNNSRVLFSYMRLSYLYDSFIPVNQSCFR